MNKKGFTLVEVLSVIILLGLLVGIAVPNIMKSSNKAKERTLSTKIKNIEKAAVLYGQDNRNSFTKDTTKSGISDCLNKYCPKDSSNNPISNCYCFQKNNKTTITVDLLANPGNDSEGNPIEPYIKYDEASIIKNPTDESKNMEDCDIQIYQKYGKIYAVYTKTKKYIDGSDDIEYNKNCWVQR